MGSRYQQRSPSRTSRSEHRKQKRKMRRMHRKSKWSNGPKQMLSQIQSKNKLLARLYATNRAILGTNQNQISFGIQGGNPNDQKTMRKILLPQDNNFNYTGLLIGPQGGNQKRLEELTGCKILVRGKGSQKQGQAPQPQDDQQLHVLIVGDTDPQVARACAQVQRIIFAPQQKRNQIRKMQMDQHERLKSYKTDNTTDLTMTTPDGDPPKNSFIIQVPNQCVGLVIGKDGQTIKMIAKKSGARKVLVATASAPGYQFRNVFVDGSHEAIQSARKILQQIVNNQRKMNCNNVNGSYRMQMQVPFRIIGLVIGKGGQTIKRINSKTGAFVSVSKQDPPNKNRKLLTITGPQNLCYAARYQIDTIVQNGLKNLQKSQQLNDDQLSMIKPLQYYPKQFENVSFTQDPENVTQNNEMIFQLNPTMSSMLYNELHRNSGPQIEQLVIQNGRKRRK